MKLRKHEILNNRAAWLKKGYTLPAFDMGAVARATHDSPEWVHFGAGNIFRAFVAEVQQQMLNEGKEHKGIVVAEGYDCEIIDRAYRPFDNLCLSVTLKSEGSILKSVLGSVV